MLKPRIKHKITDIQNQEEKYKKKTFFFIILFLFIIFSGIIFLNNYINRMVFSPKLETNYKGLTFKITTDKQTYYQGENITIKLIIINNTKKKVEMDFLTSELAYFTVYSYLDLGLTRFYYKVWTTKPSTPPIPNVYTISLKPGESLTIIKIWNQVDMKGELVKTGRYKFVVELNTLDKVDLVK